MPPSLRQLMARVAHLAWPIACTLLGETGMALVDTKLVGNLGGHALGGVAMANTIMYLAFVSILGLLRGIKVLTAHAAGAGRLHEGRRYARVGLLVGGGIGAALTWVLPAILPHLVPFWIAPELLPDAQAFVLGRRFGIPASFMVAALNEYRQGQGNVRLPMAVGLFGNILNAVLAQALVRGQLGLPVLGVFGAGLGTSITHAVQLLLFFVVELLGRRRVAFAPTHCFGELMRCARELAHIGIPTGLHAFFEYLSFVACSALLVRVGELEMAASQVVSVINRVAYMPGFAVAEVSCILVGQALGANRLQDADRAVRAGLSVAISLMVACGACFICFRRQLSAFFSADAEVALRVQKVLWVAGAFQVLDACNLVMRGALRGAQDVRAAAAIGTAVLWACVPTVTYFVGYRAQYGALGAWLSFMVATGVCAALYSHRWYFGRWRQQLPSGPQAEVAGS